MLEGFSVISGNLLMTFEGLLLTIMGFGSIIWFAKDFKLGLIINFMLFGAVFAWFYTAQMNYNLSMLIFLFTFVLMCMSLYTALSFKGTSGGAI
jgi:hypothetical protein